MRESTFRVLSIDNSLVNIPGVEIEISFSPSDAAELRTILEHGADRAFVDEACDTSAIVKAVALAAQEVGNAQQALYLLRVGAELADQYGEAPVTDAHIAAARELHLIEVAVAETMKAIRTSSGRLS